MGYRGNHETLTKHGITVTCANGGQLVSTATDIINFHDIPTEAKKCHNFPNHQLVDPLLSLGKLTEHGCNVNFTKNTVGVTNSYGITILIGQKPIGRNIYTAPLPLGTTQNIPLDITVEVPKIRGVTAATTLTATAAIKHSKMMNQPKQTDRKVIIPTKLINKSPESDFKVIIPTKLINMPDNKVMIPTKLTYKGFLTPEKMMISSRNKTDGRKIYQAEPENLFSGPKSSNLHMEPKILHKEPAKTLKDTRRTIDKKLLMPPPRTQRLNIPTSKSTYLRQNVNDPNTKF